MAHFVHRKVRSNYYILAEDAIQIVALEKGGLRGAPPPII